MNIQEKMLKNGRKFFKNGKDKKVKNYQSEINWSQIMKKIWTMSENELKLWIKCLPTVKICKKFKKKCAKIPKKWPKITKKCTKLLKNTAKIWKKIVKNHRKLNEKVTIMDKNSRKLKKSRKNAGKWEEIL